MDKTNSSSVYSLINELCIELINENSSAKYIMSPDVRKLRVKSFEILLKKCKHNINFKDYIDPLKELDIIYFGMKIKTKNTCGKLKQLEKFEEILNDISKDEYFLNSSGRSILIFLLLVKDSVLQTNHNENEFHQPLLVPGPFTLHLEYSRSLNYPHNEIKYYTNKLEHFKSISPVMNCNNPYLPQMLFEKMKNYNTQNNRKPFRILNEDKNLKSISYKYLKPFSPYLNSIENPQYCIVHYNDKEHKKINPDIPKLSKRFGWNWENLGTTAVQNERKFGSELDTSMPLEIIIDENLETKFEAKIVGIENFLTDLKSLLVGIESESFYLDENIIFHMVKNLTIYNVVPIIIHNFVQECLECGTSYRRMQIMIFNTKIDGLIFKALCSAVEDYLLIFRQFIFSYNDTKLLEFYERIKKFMRQMSSLAHVLTIHPKANENFKPPIGSQFLGYIYKEIMRVTQPDILALLVFILKRCCHVYFKNLQKWLFLGHLDDPLNEIFIGFADLYHPNTKHYFDKAYFIRKEAVPGFFLGYEDCILQCGKYTMLLKAFNPNHPIFSLQYPSVTVCLSFEELRKIENKCEKYEKEALNLCEPAISVRDVYNNNIEKKNNFYQLVLEKTRKNFENWNLEKVKFSTQDIDKKRKCLEELSAQIEQKRLHQIKEKMENIILERELAMYQQNQENRIHFIQQQQALNRIKNFGEINAILEKNENKTIGFNNKMSGIYETHKAEDQKEKGNVQTEINKKASSILPKFEICNTEIDIINCNEIKDKKIYESPEMLLIKNDGKSKKLSEAQKNKMKVLGSEYNLFDTSFKDVNCNFGGKQESAVCELSDMQKNKIKMMQNNPFQEERDTCVRKNISLDMNTERARNKKKVLESEFYILTPVSAQITTTPMSTTSDLSLEDNDVELENIENKNSCKTNENLNQNIALKDNFNKLENMFSTKDEKFITVNTELEKEAEFKEPDIVHDSVTLHGEIIEDNDHLDDVDSYERCIELILNNFKCKPKTGLVQLKDISNQFNKNNKDANIEEIIKKQFDLNSLSIITLTEFLQKSVILPLKAHLKIVNNEVMRVFLVNLDLINHFNSLRNYFFLMDGEFSSIICDELISRLEEGASPIEILNYQTLHSVLDKAIGSSNCYKNSSKLSFIIGDLPEKFDLASPSVLSNLCLSYKIDWPLNLILNPETLDKYGDIFKYLFKVRRISWVLEQSYKILKEAAKIIGKALLISPQYRRVQLIRHKFFHFVHALRNHITASALEASWKEFQDELLKAKCIEEIYRKHTTYIKKILFLCMLNKSSIDFFKAVENIFKITLRFYRNLKSKEWLKQSDDNYYVHPRFEKLLIDEKEFEKSVKYVIYLGNKIVKRGYQEEIGEFLNLVNYNQYYVMSNRSR